MPVAASAAAPPRARGRVPVVVPVHVRPAQVEHPFHGDVPLHVHGPVHGALQQPLDRARDDGLDPGLHAADPVAFPPAVPGVAQRGIGHPLLERRDERLRSQGLQPLDEVAAAEGVVAHEDLAHDRDHRPSRGAGEPDGAELLRRPGEDPAHVARAGLGARDDPVQARAVHPVHAARLRLVGPALLLELSQEVDGDDPLEDREAEPVAVATGHSRVGILVRRRHDLRVREAQPVEHQPLHLVVLAEPARSAVVGHEEGRAGGLESRLLHLLEEAAQRADGGEAFPARGVLPGQSEVLRILHRQDMGVHAAASRGGGERVSPVAHVRDVQRALALRGRAGPETDCRAAPRAGG